MNTENVLVSLTVVQKFSTVFQSRPEKHRTETFSRHWSRSGYGMRSHPTEKLDYIKILTYHNLYLYSYFFYFSLPSKFLTKPLRVLEDEVNKTKQTNKQDCKIGIYLRPNLCIPQLPIFDLFSHLQDGSS